MLHLNCTALRQSESSNFSCVLLLILLGCFSHSIGGLVCFSMRLSDVKEYEEKMLELETTGKWEMFSKEKIPYSEKADLPKEINAFIFKVLKN